ncbi:PDZ domain-containing protein [Planctomycetota bacterium]
MKKKNIILIAMLMLFCVSAGLYAETERQRRAHMGIFLDDTPLPDLLVKHLGLSPEQGIPIRNVALDSPADKAGLERDDIIIGFEGRDVGSSEELVEAVKDSEVGQEIALEIIHLGKRKTVEFSLDVFRPEPEWKYPMEPRVFQHWRPGRMFRRRHGEQNWREFDIPEPPEVDIDIRKHLAEHYFFQHGEDEDRVTVTIEGSPNDKGTKVIVRAGDDEYTTTVGEIEKLPEEYQDIVAEDVKIARDSARKSRRYRGYGIGGQRPPDFRPEPWLDRFESFFERERRGRTEPGVGRSPERMRQGRTEPGIGRSGEQIRRGRPEAGQRFGPGQEMFERVEKQMRELQQRINELEEQNQQMLERLEKEPEEESEGDQESV